MDKRLALSLWIIILIICTTAIAVPKNDDYIRICPDCHYYISCESISMYPTIDCDDTLLAMIPQNKNDLRPGDIIWYSSPKDYKGVYKDKGVIYIIHRIIRMDYKGCYITKGDNNVAEDSFHPCFYDIKFKIVGVLYA